MEPVVGECPACGNPGSIFVRDLVDRLGLVPGKFPLVECPSCGMQRLSPLPDPDLEDPFFENYWSAGSAPVSGPARVVAAAETFYKKTLNLSELRRLRGILPAGARVLDVGCGGGDALAILGGWGLRCAGLEASQAGVEAVRSTLGVEVRLGTILENDLEPGGFDLVLMSHVLEHLHDPNAALREVRRLLRPGGLACVMVPNVDSLQRRILAGRWFVYTPPRHISYFGPRSLALLFARNGFAVERVYHPTLKHGPAILVNSLFPALDPYYLRHRTGIGGALGRLAYLGLSLALAPLTLLEGCLRRGATIMVVARAPGQAPGPEGDGVPDTPSGGVPRR